ncbi:MAG: DUF1071 domain-containing protein [Prevotellaceae bacterium]|nr:DUF1071 domain-containing protein [Candidatus Colivivens equi]
MCKIQINLPVIPEGVSDNERRTIMFEYLSNLDLSEVLEKRDKLSYLSWANCLELMYKVYPTASLRVIKNPNTGLPFFSDPNTGIFVYTEVTIEGHTTECFLPVMDFKNKSMKLEPYTYSVYNNYKKVYEDKTVEAATSFDINKTIWRCLVKNVAIATGIGLNVFQKEADDIPEKQNDDQNNGNYQRQQAQPRQQYNTQRPIQTQAQPQVQAPDPTATLKATINSTNDVSALVSLYLDNTQVIEANPELKALLTNRKKALQSLNAA